MNWIDIQAGDVITRPDDPRKVPLTVKRIQPARVRGYLVVEFTNGERTQVNDTWSVTVVSFHGASRT
jgi:hypothetical protein